MSKSFRKLTRPNIRKAPIGEQINEHGITFLRLFDGDGRYTVNIMVDGQRIHRAIGNESDGVTRQQAEDFIQKVRTEARQGRLNLPKGRKLTLGFKEAAEKYLEMLKQEGGKDIKSKTMRLKHHLKPFFASKPLAKISTFDVERYKKHRLEENAAKGTINRELAALSHLFSKSVEWKWVNHKPATIKRLKEDSGRIIYLTTEQIDDLIKAAISDQFDQLYPFIVIGLETSLRRSEILSIKIGNIDIDKQVIYIPQSKTGAREQPITAYLAEFLKSYIEAAPDEQIWFFPSAKSKTGHTVNIEKPWKRVVLAAGLDPTQVVRHTLRHTAITHLVQAGVDLPTVKRISGHKTLAMVERYSHQNGEHIRAAMSKLDSRYRVKG
jgi:integrase